MLVLTPTRELASQVAQSFRTYGAGLKLSVAVIFGGVSQRPQVEALKRGVDILVATPGRLLDLIDQRTCRSAAVEILVVDEADQMLDLGFIVPLRKIVKMVPEKRQTLFFSATMPKTIAELADQLLTDPVQVAVAPVASTVERVDAERDVRVRRTEAGAAQPHPRRPGDGARARLHPHQARRRQGGAQSRPCAASRPPPSTATRASRSASGRLPPSSAGTTRVLVATDIAARGIHVENVSHVVNYELPNVPESYVHRIGRTARAGAAGIAISFCNGEERAFLRDIEKLTRTSRAGRAASRRHRGRRRGSPRQSRTPGRSSADRNEPRRREAGRSRRTARSVAAATSGAAEKGGQSEGRTRAEARALFRPRPEDGLPAFLSRPTRRDDRAEA